jgi:hypothetical protein
LEKKGDKSAYSDYLSRPKFGLLNLFSTTSYNPPTLRTKKNVGFASTQKTPKSAGLKPVPQTLDSENRS